MNFLGQFDCTMDDKGRIKMPASLRKQFADNDKGKFMIAKDLEDCLVIYTVKAWEQQAARLQKLNPFNLKHQQFISAVTVGLTEVEMDGADRFLVSKSLIKYLGNGKNIVMKGKFDRIQVWDADKFEQYTQGNIANVQSLSDEVSGYLDELEQRPNQPPRKGGD
ncbi:MAG: division/cell wall cluster transcriptional repressor MraZ [Bacteroidetes bacterium]|nr:division/cell wall cluster transcriptional repressor MraZ [Bacteroidota bacterium]